MADPNVLQAFAFLPLIGMGVSAISSLFGRKKQDPNAFDPMQNPEVAAALKGLKIPATTPAETNTASGFYNTILKGSQTETESMLAPEVSTIVGQYDAASRAAAEMGPRGGGRTAAMAELPFQKIGAYGKLLASLKSGAAGGLEKIGAEKQQAATARREQDVGTFSSLLQGSEQQQRLKYDQQQANISSWKELGSGIGSLLVQGAKSGWFGGKKQAEN